MKRVIILLSVLLLQMQWCIPLKASEISVESKAQVLKIGYIESYGVDFSQDTQKYEGYFVDYLDKILEYTQGSYEIQWVSGDWDEFPDMLRSGEIDLMLPTRANAVFGEEFIRTEENIGTNMLLLVTDKSKNILFDDYSSINSSTIAVRENYQYLMVLEDFLAEHELTPEIVTVGHEAYEDGVFAEKYDFCIANSMHVNSGFSIVAKMDTEPVYLVGHSDKVEVLADLDYGILKVEESEFFFQQKLYLSYFDQNVDTDKILTREDYELLREQEVYNLGYSPSYSPLTYLDENGEIIGISVEMMNKIAEEVGIEFNWIDVTQLQPEELDQIDISLMAPNYSNGKFAENQSDPYFYYSYVLVESYDYVGKSHDIGILNFYDVEQRILDAVRGSGEMVIYPNYVTMETAFFEKEVGGIIVTNTIYNKMRSEVKAEQYMVTPIDAKLDVTLAFPSDFPPEKVAVFNKLIATLDSLELEYLFSEHMTVVVREETPETTIDIIKKYWEVVGASFIFGSMSFLFIFTLWLQMQRKKLKALAETDTAIISCAKTLLGEQQEDPLALLLKIICEYYHGEFAYIYEVNPRHKREKKRELSYEYASADAGKNIKYLSPTGFLKGEKWKECFEKNNHLFLENGDENLGDYPPCDVFLGDIINKNILIIPLEIRGELVGLMGINNIQRNTKKFQLVTTVSAFISNNLEIAYFQKDLQCSVAELEQKNLENQAVFECVSTLVYDENFKESVKKLLKIICTYFKGERAYILMKEKPEEDRVKGSKTSDIELTIMEEYLSGKDVKPSVANRHHISYVVVHRWYEAMHQDHVMQVKNAKQEIPEEEHNTKEYGLFKPEESFVCTPIFQHDEIIGFLWVDNPKINGEDASLLKTIAAFIANHLMKNDMNQVMKRMSFQDSLTGLYNRNYYMETFVKHSTKHENMGIIFADVNGLKKANDNLGHEYGDLLLKGCAKFFQTYTTGTVMRLGGDEYVCIMEETSEHDFKDCVKTLIDTMTHHGDVHISIGSIWSPLVSDIEKQVGEADKLMYIEKQKYYEEKRKDPRSEEEQMESFRKSIAALENDLEQVL